MFSTNKNFNGIREDLLRGIYAYGFEKPSAIQQRAIKQIIKGRDVIAQAQSGTGKTATFSISTLQVLDTSVRETQGKINPLVDHTHPYKIALILCPTRELAQQVQKVILALGDYMNVQAHVCIGGTNVGEDSQTRLWPARCCRHPGSYFRYDSSTQSPHPKHQAVDSWWGRRNVEQGIQRTNLRRLPLSAFGNSGEIIFL